MKTKLFISLAWVVGTFLLLSWMLYAANNYESSMSAAVAEPQGLSSLEHLKALDAQQRDARTQDEMDAIWIKLRDEMARKAHLHNASISRRLMLERAWLLWSVSAFVPLVFLWWTQLPGVWQRIQTGSAAARPGHVKEKIPDETHAI